MTAIEEVEHSADRTKKLANEVAAALEDTETVDDVWSERSSVSRAVKMTDAIKMRVENDELLYDIYVVPVDEGD